jgi:hypothetical protein
MTGVSYPNLHEFHSFMHTFHSAVHILARFEHAATRVFGRIFEVTPVFERRPGVWSCAVRAGVRFCSVSGAQGFKEWVARVGPGWMAGSPMDWGSLSLSVSMSRKKWWLGKIFEARVVAGGRRDLGAELVVGPEKGPGTFFG